METNYLGLRSDRHEGFDPTVQEVQQRLESLRSLAEMRINGPFSWGLCLTSLTEPRHRLDAAFNRLPWYQVGRMVWQGFPYSHGFFDNNVERELYAILPLSDMNQFDPRYPERTKGGIKILGDSYEERVRNLAREAFPQGLVLTELPKVEGFCTWHVVFNWLTLEAVEEQLAWAAKVRERRDSYRYFLIDHGYTYPGVNHWDLPEGH